MFFQHIKERWSLAGKVFLIVVVPGVLIQYVVRLKGWNILDMNIIIASLLTGAVFLIGFMLAGTMQDFKESEKLLGNIANNILSIQDQNRMGKNKKNKSKNIRYLIDLTKTIKEWLEQKTSLEKIMDKINKLSEFFPKFKNSDFISRAEIEQRELRQGVMRINVIKKTTFIQAGYTIMEIISFVVCILIIFSKTDTFILAVSTYASSSFILVYMILLIKDMDDPFQFRSSGKSKGSAEVSLMPLNETIKFLEKEEKIIRFEKK